MTPTRQQLRKADYEQEEFRDTAHGRILRRHKRVPKVVRMAMGANATITQDEAKALLWYRDRYEASQRSYIMDSLGKHQPVDGGGDPEKWRLRIADAEHDWKFAEAGVPEWLRPTLRDIALHDYDATEVAREALGWDYAPEKDIVMSIMRERTLDAMRKKVMRQFKAAANMLHAQIAHMLEVGR